MLWLWVGDVQGQVRETGVNGAGALQTVPSFMDGVGLERSDGTRARANRLARTAVDSDAALRREAADRRDVARDYTKEVMPAPARDRPTEFQQLVEATTAQALPIFGESLFQEVPSTFAPVDNLAVAPDYVLGTGDEVHINLFGQVNRQMEFIVDRTGAIEIPEIGPVHVEGLRFEDLPKSLRAQFVKLYRNFDLTVNLGKLRTIPIFVLGQARRPGMYSVGSLSTLVNALFACGGVLPQGSLRTIHVLRGGRNVATFDLYDLLLRGDKSKDVKLQPGDVIFLPVAGPQVAVVGSVVNPAIYEVLPGTTVQEAIDAAGGGTGVAALAKVRLDRIFEHSMRSVVDVNLADAKLEQNPAVANGDILTVGAIGDRFKNAVTLRGNVANPGRYVWHAGMRISDVLPNKESLVTRDYFRRRNELGQFVTEFDVHAQPAHEGGDAATETGRPGGVSTTGMGGASVAAALTADDGVFRPRTDVVMTGPDVNWSYAVIERQSPVDLTTTLIPFSPGKVLLENDRGQNLELLANDVVTIFSTADIRVPSEQQTRFVRLEGEFAAAGVYSVRPGETVRQLLTRAGGLTGDAYLYGSTFTRQSTRRLEKQRLLEFADALEAQVVAFTATTGARAVNANDAAASEAGTSDARRVIARLRLLEPEGRIVLRLKPESDGIASLPDLALEDGDRFVVPRTPAVVNVQGQVYSANAFIFERGRETRDYLKYAGGPDRMADTKRSFVLRADGSVLSRQYGDVARAQIFPGDTIVIPPQIERRAVLRNLLDLSSIASQFGLGAAAINVLK